MAEESYNLSDDLFEMGSLILKYNQGELTEEEKTILDNWMNESSDNNRLFATPTDNEELQTRLNQLHEIEGTRNDARKRVMELLFPGALVTPIKRATYSIGKTVAAAAIVAVVAGTG